MTQVFSSRIRLGIALAILSAFLVSCATEASSKYWGQVEVPQDNVMHYITGGEPESLDPQFVTGQPEARMLIGLYDRLVEYHPKTMQPIPSMATNWEVSDDLVKYTFHLRQDGRFSNGDPIKADAFAWSFRRALSPELASRYAFLGYDIKYGEAYNSGKSFVKKDGKFLLEKDFQENVGDEDKDGKKDPISEEKPEELKKKQAEETAPVTDEKLKSQEKEVEKPAAENVGTTVDVEKEKSETEFEKYINSPTRLALPSDAFPLAKEVEGSRKLKDLFKYEVSDLGDAVGFAKKLSSSNDALSEFVKSKINPQAINACQNSGSCDENAKSQIVADLNKIISEEALYSPERFKPLIDAKQLSEPSVKLIENFDKENKKIADKNAEIDTQVTELTDAKEKAEKAKTKKEKITKLFYMNRFLLGEFYKNGLEKLPLEPVKAEDIGVEAIDDYTFRITLKQPAPYFTGLLTHQFFSALHRPTIEKYGTDWIKPEHIVTSGAFKLKEWKPYDELTIVKDPMYWDAKNVKLDAIVFYPMDEQTTMMNIYKSGRVDALYNHTVPAAWNDYIKQFKNEYLLFPEVATEYYTFSVKKPPVDKVEVRKAFSLAVDRDALEVYRKTIKKSAEFVPVGIFPEYEKARTKVYARLAKENGITPEEMEKRLFNPEKACELMEKAGYTVKKKNKGCKVTDFPADQIQLSYNTAESNKQVAEFVQAQWKQNLGITVQLKNMEFKTYLPYRSAIQYTGMARAGWVGDFMDPYTFLSQFYSPKNDSSTGYWDPKYDALLDKANNTKDPTERFEILAEAEFYVLEDQPVMPLSTSGTSWMKKPYIKGMYPNPGTMHPWKFVYIETDKSKWDENVNNVMTNSDAKVDAEVEALMKTQTDFEKSQTPESKRDSGSDKVE